MSISSHAASLIYSQIMFQWGLCLLKSPGRTVLPLKILSHSASASALRLVFIPPFPKLDLPADSCPGC